MTTTAINFKDLLSNINLSEITTKEYVVRYCYFGCANFFEKHIIAECDAEAIYDAKDFINSRNAEVANKPKVGNYIILAIVSEWSGRSVATIKF